MAQRRESENLKASEPLHKKTKHDYWAYAGSIVGLIMLVLLWAKIT